MSIERFAINASPLITLHRAQLDWLLPRLFNHVLVPDAVWREVVSQFHDDPVTRQLPTADWAIRQAVTVRAEVLAWNLGAGETALLSLGMAEPDTKVILDDRSATRCARVPGISSMGTAAVLVMARRRGLIPSVEQALRQLQAAGAWISETLIQKLAAEDARQPLL